MIIFFGLVFYVAPHPRKFFCRRPWSSCN